MARIVAESSEPSKRLGSNNDHCFTWTVISDTSIKAKTKKNLNLILTKTGLWKTIFI